MSSYKRSSSSSSRVRIRKRPVSFGNPSLGTYHGVVYTMEQPNMHSDISPFLEDSNSLESAQPTQFLYAHDCSKHPKPLVEGALPVERPTVAIVDVPPEQVPEGVLNLARAHVTWIDHVRVVIADPLSENDNDENAEKEENAKEKMVQLKIDTRTQDSLTDYLDLDLSIDADDLLAQALSPVNISAVENAASILAAESEQQITAIQAKEKSNSVNISGKTDSDSVTAVANQFMNKVNHNRTYLVLFELCNDKAANQMVNCLNGQPYTCLDETVVCNIQHVLALQGQDGVSLMSPFFAVSTKSTQANSSAANAVLEIVLSESTASSSTSATAASAAQLQEDGATLAASEVYNCAVCLDHMDFDHRSSTPTATSTSSSTNHAILTTVCNHTFHMDCLLKWQDSPCPVCRYDHSGLNETLSRCHICDRTENNFVCLICGVVSCGGGGAIRTFNASETILPDVPVAASRSLKKGSSSESLESSVHQTQSSSTQQRMLFSSHARQHYDETLHAYALDTESQHVWDFAGQGYVHRLLQNKEDGKLVEVADPNNTTSQERSLNPGLSDSQEGEVLHRKLEGFASQYYTLLKSQLEQQRIHYQGRLQEIRREYELQSQPRKTSDLITALKQERHQLSQRLESLKGRCAKVSADVSFLKNMNESLDANKEPLKKALELAQHERIDTKLMFEQCLPALQEKVSSLMLQLEHGDCYDEKVPLTKKQISRRK